MLISEHLFVLCFQKDEGCPKSLWLIDTRSILYFERILCFLFQNYLLKDKYHTIIKWRKSIGFFSKLELSAICLSQQTGVVAVERFIGTVFINITINKIIINKIIIKKIIINKTIINKIIIMFINKISQINITINKMIININIFLLELPPSTLHCF